MKIADEVVTVIAGLAATEVKGVASLAGGITNDTVARRGIKALLKGVRVSVMRQYTPIPECRVPGLDRRITEKEYSRVRDHSARRGRRL